jgi:hypothetical protein
MLIQTYYHKRTGKKVDVHLRLSAKRGLLYVTTGGIAVEANDFVKHFVREG